MKDNHPQILLHACCAVCMAYPIKILQEHYEPIVFFYNPNIYPQTEYDRRKNELIKYCEKMNYKYIIEQYDSEAWYEYIQGFENEPEKGGRCNKCFEFRLTRTAQIAKKLKINYFTTTLSVSPHKVSQNIFVAGNNIASQYNIKFIQQDFKKQNGFLKTMELAKENNFYRQNYCGCEYSIKNIKQI